MDQTKKYILKLFEAKKVAPDDSKSGLLDAFLDDENVVRQVELILATQKSLISIWIMKSRLEDIYRQSVVIPNGTIGKEYSAVLDFKQLGWDDVTYVELIGLDGLGVTYESQSSVIAGIPVQSGDFKLKLKFRLKGSTETAPLNEKIITLTINPDPKTLWKNKPSDTEGIYWKEDNIATAATLGDRHIVVASKRGRSHANVGSYRDDDFSFKHFDETGWNVIAVADGAGSARLSRQGSAVACNAIIDYFGNNITPESSQVIDETLGLLKAQGGEEVQKKLSQLISDLLSKAAWFAHQSLVTLSKESGNDLKDFHSTLIFTAYKKYSFGYAFLSFGVGDCPIALITKGESEVILMNWLDVGEYGGGTRFITMPDIFTSDKFYTRFKFKLVDDFSYLMMMTDGVYDPKFIVEANLEKLENWKVFLADLNGENEDKAAVDFNPENKNIAQQLSAWMDFWSPGNHDDRTLAIVY